MTDVARHLTIHGRVQGVFFRDSCRAEAQRLGVRGWVSNEPDRTVQAWLEGDPDAVDPLVTWCRQGPPRAQVERVEISEVVPEGYSGFEVR